jgi:hypothetical protein
MPLPAASRFRLGSGFATWPLVQIVRSFLIDEVSWLGTLKGKNSVSLEKIS